MIGDHLWHWFAVVFAGFIAGAVNSIAGGGTNVSFPTLVWLGFPPVPANTSNAVGLWPGAIGGAWGYRKEIYHCDKKWLWLAVPSLAGGIAGAYLLLKLPPVYFKSIAPFLVLASSAAIAIEPLIRRYLERSSKKKGSGIALILHSIISVYGGYFGAGLGILMLAALSFFRVGDLQTANALKNLLSVLIKSGAVVYFVIKRTLMWHAAIMIMIGAVPGGYVGAVIARKLERKWLVTLVVTLGFAMGLIMLVRNF
jgi:uncharacterized membrane protein YfcA